LGKKMGLGALDGAPTFAFNGVCVLVGRLKLLAH